MDIAVKLNRSRLLLGVLLPIICASSQVVGWAADFPIQTELKGPKSIYTDQILARLMSLIPKAAAAQESLSLRCIETPEQGFYIGLEQSLVINAPLERVTAVMDDIDHYSDIFPDMEKTQIVSKDGNHWLTSWEQKVPVIFVPNIKYQVDYLSASPSPTTRVYRYQLHESDHIIYSDGFILLRAIDAQHTHYLELDFYDAHWGLAKIAGQGKIWSDSAEGLALSDLGAKLKSENPTWDKSQVLDGAKKLLKSQKIDTECHTKVMAADYFLK